jgi:hypothetical protein
MSLLVAVSARAGGIFDDNWTPPARRNPAKTNTTSSPRLPADMQPAARPARRPIPGKLDQARSRDNLKEIFGPDMADSSLAGRRKLAAKLFDAVPRTADNPVDQYVLLGAAINAATEGDSLRMCVQTAEFLSQMFEVDGVALEADAALNMNLRGGSPADAADNAAAELEVLNSLIAEDDFVLASKLIAQLKGLATAVPSLGPTILKKGKELEALRQEHDRFVQQAELLKARPDDPAANLVVGRYYCFRHGDWEKGLPYLAKGSDAALKKAAGDELSGPMSAKENELVGDGWWAAAENLDEPLRGAIREHAASFYTMALNSTTGLARMKMAERVAEVPGAKPPGPVSSQAAASPQILRLRELLEKKYIGQRENGQRVEMSLEEMKKAFQDRSDSDFKVVNHVPKIRAHAAIDSLITLYAATADPNSSLQQQVELLSSARKCIKEAIAQNGVTRHKVREYFFYWDKALDAIASQSDQKK